MQVSLTSFYVSSNSELFISRDVSETTTKQIAERAQVNEVTLLRHFGQLAALLHGVLLGVIELTSEFHHLWQEREDFFHYLHRAKEKAALEQAIHLDATSHPI